MARHNYKRVNDILDYEQHIKGKRLIRLSAGVCSGKNHWVRVTAEKYNDLRILLITSRKNVVIAQANKMKASTFIDLDNLDENDSIMQNKKNVVCTNASIENFFKYRYDANNPKTHLWDKFDLIVLDEAHALTTDATFTDNFYTERLLKHTYYKNQKCDIIFMSGTIMPIDWMLNAKNTPKIHDINLFVDCVHLEPKYVLVFNKQRADNLLLKKLNDGERVVYFANHKRTIGNLTKWLLEKGISPDELGYSFNYADKDKKYFPEKVAVTLKDRIEEMNTALTTTERIDADIKVLFTTSKNREGINILDDDIKTAFAETHNKSELIQIAGRVRGNEEDGEGIDTLVIISDANQHSNYSDEFKYFMNRKILNSLDSTLTECLSNEKNKHLGVSSPLEMQKKLLKYNGFEYVLYDFIEEKFTIYQGRVEGERQHTRDLREFEDIISNTVTKNGNSYSGRYIFEKEWFRYSDVFILHENVDDIKKDAGDKLRQFLYRNNFMGEDTKINIEDRDTTIKAEIKRLAELYGYKNLNLREGFKIVGKALRKFDLQIIEANRAKGYEKFYIIDLRK